MTQRRRATRGNKRPHVERGRRRGNLPTPQAQKQNNPHTMRDKEHRYDTRRRQIFLFPPLILRSETEQEKKHRATMQNWRHLEGGEASVKRYLMTDANKERSPKDESQRV